MRKSALLQAGLLCTILVVALFGFVSFRSEPSHRVAARSLLRATNSRGVIYPDWDTWFDRVTRKGESHKFAPSHPPVIKPKWTKVGGTSPTQGHISYPGDPSQMRVMWATAAATKTSTVQYRRANETKNAMREATGTSTEIDKKSMCAPPATTHGWTSDLHYHDVLLSGLDANTQYLYRFGDESGGWSDEFSFKTAPVPHRDMETHILLIGDMGQRDEEPGAASTTMNIIKEAPRHQMLLHVGDIAYAFGYSQLWDVFFDEVEPVATRLPYQVMAGNHEIQTPDSGGECGVPFHTRFHMPDNGERNLWYSFNWGNIHFLIVSTEHNFMSGTPQRTFIEQDLNSIDRTVTPWVIVSGHRPMYSGKDFAFSEGLQDELEELLSNHKVDLALWGHVHSYERSCPVRGGLCADPHGDKFVNPTAPVHAIIGMSGRTLAELEPERPWETVRIKQYGYCRLHSTATTLHFEFVQNNDGRVHDEFTITKTQ